MYTTLKKIQKHSPCIDGWKLLLKKLDKTKADDEPLSILTILDSNGLDDTLWCLRAIDGYEATMRKFAKWCALQNIEKIKPYCSLEDYGLILDYLNSDTNATVRAAARAANAAARAATRATAREAAWAAKAANAAAWAEVDAAAYSAVRAATAEEADIIKEKQEEKLRELLKESK